MARKSITVQYSVMALLSCESRSTLFAPNGSPSLQRRVNLLAAERGRFELPRSLRLCHFSKVVHSTTLPPLQRDEITIA